MLSPTQIYDQIATLPHHIFEKEKEWITKKADLDALEATRRRDERAANPKATIQALDDALALMEDVKRERIACEETEAAVQEAIRTYDALKKLANFEEAKLRNKILE